MYGDCDDDCCKKVQEELDEREDSNGYALCVSNLATNREIICGAFEVDDENADEIADAIDDICIDGCAPWSFLGSRSSASSSSSSSSSSSRSKKTKRPTPSPTPEPSKDRLRYVV